MIILKVITIILQKTCYKIVPKINIAKQGINLVNTKKDEYSSG
jgi:hypothetical protein